MKNYRIDFDLLNKQVSLMYNQSATIASNISFTADLISAYAFYPALKRSEDDEFLDMDIMDYYTIEWFSSEEHYIFIQRHSLTDINKKIIDKDIELKISIFTKDFMNNVVTFHDLYTIFLDDADSENMAVREGYLAGIIEMCEKRKINTAMSLR